AVARTSSSSKVASRRKVDQHAPSRSPRARQLEPGGARHARHHNVGGARRRPRGGAAAGRLPRWYSATPCSSIESTRAPSLASSAPSGQPTTSLRLKTATVRPCRRSP
ncbi:hypothetical protein HK405_013447, partial [Cladochytrium tenue]